jgi:hypothetical protein
VARVAKLESSHWYSRDGKPCHEQLTKKGTPTPTTLRHAKVQALLPSVTSILSIADKPALTAWKIEQACLAVLTAPRKDGEEVDAFVKRVLQEERQQDEVATAAADLGTRIHASIATLLNGEQPDSELEPYWHPASAWLDDAMGICCNHIEEIVVGDGYAGCCDLRGALMDGTLVVVDWKSTKKIPDEPYAEHCEQVSAYAAAWPAAAMNLDKCRAFIGYISTTEPGQFTALEVTDLEHHYRHGFLPCLELWIKRKQYDPRITTATVNEAITAGGL